MSFFAQNLRYLREEQGLSKKELAQKTHSQEDRITSLENAQSEPSTGELERLSAIFEITIDRLIRIDLYQTIDKLKGREFKLLVLDVDGVMTDGGMYYAEGGDEFKKFNTKDGIAIKQVVSQGMVVGIISSGYNFELINRRSELLGIQHVYTGSEPKLVVIKKWCEQHQYSMDSIAYVGDDINDIEVMQAVGLSACPSDAVERVRNIAGIVLERQGGEGCIREFVDHYLLNL